MSKLGLLKKVLSVPALVALIFFLQCYSSVEARNLEIQNVVIQAELLADGNMKVRESRTVMFTGSYSGADQKLLYGGPLEYKEISFSENGLAYRFVDDYPTASPGTYTLKVFGGGEYHDWPYPGEKRDYLLVDWSFKTNAARRTFTLEYLVENVIFVHNDIAELYYNFVGSEWEHPSEIVTVTLTLPPGAVAEELLAWGHGPLYGSVRIISPAQIRWEVSPLPARTALTGRVVLPLTLVPGASVSSERDGLQAIMAEEEALARRAENLKFIFYKQWLIALGSTAITVLLIALTRFKAMNRKGVFMGRYYRELPTAFPPEIVGYLEYKKRVKTSFFAARVLDLARRGYIKIEEVDSDYFLNRKKQGNIRLTEIKTAEPGDNIDTLVMELFFDRVSTVSPYGSLLSTGDIRRTITSEQINAYAKAKPWIFASYIHKWENAIVSLAEKERFFSETPVPVGLFFYICLLGFFAIYAFAVVGLVMLPLILLLQALLSYIFHPRIQLTEHGADQHNRWKAFKRFLLHFSRLNEATPGSVSIWEHYLVYAVVLGVSDQVAVVLKMLNQQSTPDPVFRQGLLFHLGDGYINNSDRGYGVITQSINSSIHLANMQSAVGIKGSMQQLMRNYAGLRVSSSSSSTGLGGGFSAGGGGGLGGGGGSFR